MTSSLKIVIKSADVSKKYARWGSQSSFSEGCVIIVFQRGINHFSMILVSQEKAGLVKMLILPKNADVSTKFPENAHTWTIFENYILVPNTMSNGFWLFSGGWRGMLGHEILRGNFRGYEIFRGHFRGQEIFGSF